MIQLMQNSFINLILNKKLNVQINNNSIHIIYIEGSHMEKRTSLAHTVHYNNYLIYDYYKGSNDINSFFQAESLQYTSIKQ